jgi:hypothetical protein
MPVIIVYIEILILLGAKDIPAYIELKYVENLPCSRVILKTCLKTAKPIHA